MDRINKILNDEEYKSIINNIEYKEKDRVFCLHGLDHALDVARIGYIIILEENLLYERDVFYAAALLHDIGRYSENEEKYGHHFSGAELAEKILVRAEYTEDEIKEICEAISLHKNRTDGGLSEVLFRADKLSRNCFKCASRELCYWNENVKNKELYR